MLSLMRMKSLFVGSCLFLMSCGINFYPGQPGIVTNGSAKIDLEILDGAGLWVYEVDYDNRLNGPGVNSIVTKLYPGALTYSSNVRTNAEGTLFRHKFESRGAEIQMISFPRKKQVIFPEDTKVALLLNYETSFDEVDDRNVAEAEIFARKTEGSKLFPQFLKVLKDRFSWIKAGTMQPNGRLSYRIVEVELEKKVFKLEQPLTLETNLIQTGIFVNLSEAVKESFIDFLDTNFAGGFEGTAVVKLSNEKSLRIPLNIMTPRGLTQRGESQIVYTSKEEMASLLALQQGVSK